MGSHGQLYCGGNYYHIILVYSQHSYLDIHFNNTRFTELQEVSSKFTFDTCQFIRPFETQMMAWLVAPKTNRSLTRILMCCIIEDRCFLFLVSGLRIVAIIIHYRIPEKKQRHRSPRLLPSRPVAPGRWLCYTILN